MTTLALVAPRAAALALAVSITGMAGVGLANQTYSPSTAEAWTARWAPVVSTYSNIRAQTTKIAAEPLPKALAI